MPFDSEFYAHAFGTDFQKFLGSQNSLQLFGAKYILKKLSNHTSATRAEQSRLLFAISLTCTAIITQMVK